MEEVPRRLNALGLSFHRPERAIICRRCGYALQPSGETVSKHLGTKHQISRAARQGLTAMIRSLDLPDPNQLPRRPDGGPPHADLLVHSGGAACRRCAFRSINPELVRRHVKKQHGQRSDRHWLGDSIRSDVSLQSWTQNGPRGYWTVAAVDGPLGSSTPSLLAEGSPRRRQRLQVIHAAEKERAAAERQIRATDPEIDDPAFISNWMRRTDWARILHGADRRFLSRLTESPVTDGDGLELGHLGDEVVWSRVDDESKLVAIGHAVDRFLDRCEDTGRHTDHSLRCWLRSQIPRRPYKAPFELPARATTRTRYHLLWKRLMYCAFRLSRLDPAVCTAVIGTALSETQRTAIERVWASLDGESADPSPPTARGTPSTRRGDATDRIRKAEHATTAIQPRARVPEDETDLMVPTDDLPTEAELESLSGSEDSTSTDSDDLSGAQSESPSEDDEDRTTLPIGDGE